MSNHRITSYQLFVMDKVRAFNFQGRGVRHPDAQIAISTEDGYYIRVYFMPGDEELPQHHEPANKRPNLFLYSRQYTWCVDLLRNEGPQWIFWDGNNFYLGTGREPVGSGDEV